MTTDTLIHLDPSFQSDPHEDGSQNFRNGSSRGGPFLPVQARLKRKRLGDFRDLAESMLWRRGRQEFKSPYNPWHHCRAQNHTNPINMGVVKLLTMKIPCSILIALTKKNWLLRQFTWDESTGSPRQAVQHHRHERKKITNPSALDRVVARMLILSTICRSFNVIQHIDPENNHFCLWKHFGNYN